MHDHDAEGNAYFKCDFCRSPWSEDRPMVEGHRGSLICGSCLRVAYREVVVDGGGVEAVSGVACVLCLQTNDVRHWPSPLDASIVACEGCITRAARTLEKDPDFGWVRPGADQDS